MSHRYATAWFEDYDERHFASTQLQRDIRLKQSIIQQYSRLQKRTWSS